MSRVTHPYEMIDGDCDQQLPLSGFCLYLIKRILHQSSVYSSSPWGTQYSDSSYVKARNRNCPVLQPANHIERRPRPSRRRRNLRQKRFVAAWQREGASLGRVHKLADAKRRPIRRVAHKNAVDMFISSPSGGGLPTNHLQFPAFRKPAAIASDSEPNVIWFLGETLS